MTAVLRWPRGQSPPSPGPDHDGGRWFDDRAHFTISRTGPLAGRSSVVWATANYSAGAGTDYVAVPPTTVNFAAGETVRTVSVIVNGDVVGEATEAFLVKLSYVSGTSSVSWDHGQQQRHRGSDFVGIPGTTVTFAPNERTKQRRSRSTVTPRANPTKRSSSSCPRLRPASSSPMHRASGSSPTTTRRSSSTT